MAEQITPVEAPAEDRTELQQELDRRNEEILRLRDLLIARDAELGSYKGQVAQLEAGTARLLSLVDRVRSLLPGFVWSALAALRRGRGPQS
jgi:predicted  nucleic acid-binding Zn-ribbon protein